MVIKEIKQNEGTLFCVHSSDDGKMIRKIGTEEVYSEAWDLIPCQYEYEETDIDINETE